MTPEVSRFGYMATLPDSYAEHLEAVVLSDLEKENPWSHLPFIPLAVVLEYV